MAISIEHIDEVDRNIELERLASSASLIEADPLSASIVERCPSIPSVHSPVRTTPNLFLRVLRRIWALFKTLLSGTKLFIVMFIYSALGARLFMWIETPNNLNQKEEAFQYHLTVRDTLLSRLRTIHDDDDDDDRENRWKEAIINFENAIGFQEPKRQTDWTFWVSFLYAGTMTIGDDNIACETGGGRLMTIFYSVLGIPLTLLVLSDLIKKMLKFVRKLKNLIDDLILFIGLRVGIFKLDPARPPRFHLPVIAQRAVTIGIFGNEIDASIDSLNDSIEVNKRNIEAKPPIIVTFGFTIFWLLLCAAILCIWKKDWPYWTSFYFFFRMLTTFGVDDVSPAPPECILVTFGMVLVTLALVVVCVYAVQAKLNQLYMALLQKTLLDLRKAAQRGHQETAVSRMMAKFQYRAKFLLPLISKSQGVKVMAQFKEEAKAKGIELPPVVTDVDPETGIPAFAKAKPEEFQQYIEKANEQAKPLDVRTVEVQTEAEIEPTVKPIELPVSQPAKATMSSSFTQYELITSSVQSQTTDLIRMIDAQVEAKIYADSTGASIQEEQVAFAETATQAH